jgi:NTE family protein
VASRVVAVFSGGGAKALAHLGAWRALREVGITPVHIVATSFGAVIGAALAAGRSPEEIASHFSEFSRKDVAALDPLSLFKGFFAKSLLKDAPLRSTIARLVPARRFEDLEIPLTVTATDLDTGELKLFVTGDLQAALYASCALPLYYPPAVIDGRRYADGGLRAVLPLEPAARIPADVVVAVSVGPGFDEVLLPSVRPSAVPPLVRAHGESERIMMAAQTERQIAAWGGGAKLIVVRAVAEKEATFRLEDAGRFMRVGYEATKAALGRA